MDRFKVFKFPPADVTSNTVSVSVSLAELISVPEYNILFSIPLNLNFCFSRLICTVIIAPIIGIVAGKVKNVCSSSFFFYPPNSAMAVENGYYKSCVNWPRTIMKIIFQARERVVKKHACVWVSEGVVDG